MTQTSDTTNAHRIAGLSVPEGATPVLSVTGEDRATFLQGIVSQDISNASPGDVRYTLFLDPKAHILFESWVGILPDEILLIPTKTTGDALLAHLSKYLFFRTKAKVVLANDRFRIATMAGPRVMAILTRHLLPGDSGVRSLSEGGYVFFHPGTFQRETPVGTIADLLVPRENADSFLEPLSQGLLSAGGCLLTEQGLQTYRIEMGMPSCPAELNENHFPAEAGLEEVGVSFTKGCFVGQEPVTRIKFQGKLNRGLAGFTLSGTGPIEGTLPETILDPSTQTHVGTLTSAAFSSFRGETVGLGYLKNSHAEPGTELVLTSGRTLHVTPLP